MIGTRPGVLACSRRCESRKILRHLSPTIGTKQHFLTVNLTVKFRQRCVTAVRFSYLQVLETIEWE